MTGPRRRRAWRRMLRVCGKPLVLQSVMPVVLAYTLLDGYRATLVSFGVNALFCGRLFMSPAMSFAVA